MTPPSTQRLAAIASRPSDGRTDRTKQPPRRREALRLGVIGAVASAIAIVVGCSYLVVTPLVLGWWLERQGATVSWEFDLTNWRHGGVTSVTFSPSNGWNPQLGNGDLESLRHLHRVVSLNLAESNKITGKGLAALRGLDYLQELTLDRLVRYRHPDWLLQQAPLTDSCLAHLQALPRLENLGLAGNRITDTGLPQIARMSNLRVLDLCATEVTDAGLIHLEGMKNLTEVNLGATRVTQGGLMRLQSARPDLKIVLECDPAVEEGVKQLRDSYP
jgi:hypothetical protein